MILQSLMGGDANKVIARRLDITESTIKVHVKSILRKIGAANRTQAAMWANENLRAAEKRPSRELMRELLIAGLGLRRFVSRVLEALRAGPQRGGACCRLLGDRGGSLGKVRHQSSSTCINALFRDLLFDRSPPAGEPAQARRCAALRASSRLLTESWRSTRTLTKSEICTR